MLQRDVSNTDDGGV